MMYISWQGGYKKQVISTWVNMERGTAIYSKSF
jgi:hypothetical protein